MIFSILFVKKFPHTKAFSSFILILKGIAKIPQTHILHSYCNCKLSPGSLSCQFSIGSVTLTCWHNQADPRGVLFCQAQTKPELQLGLDWAKHYFQFPPPTITHPTRKVHISGSRQLVMVRLSLLGAISFLYNFCDHFLFTTFVHNFCSQFSLTTFVQNFCLQAMYTTLVYNSYWKLLLTVCV